METNAERARAERRLTLRLADLATGPDEPSRPSGVVDRTHPDDLDATELRDRLERHPDDLAARKALASIDRCAVEIAGWGVRQARGLGAGDPEGRRYAERFERRRHARARQSLPVAAGMHRVARPRGAGRPRTRAVARASSRGGDSGDDSSGSEPPGETTGPPLLFLVDSRYGRVNRALARFLRGVS